MVERDGRVVYVDQHGAEWYLVSPEAFALMRPRLSEPMQQESKPAHKHLWGDAQRVQGTHLTRMRCMEEGCGAVSYG
jgi:hypothetical protein